MVRFAILSAACLSALVVAGPAHAEDLVFLLDNQTSGGVREFYTSPVDVNNWEADVLGVDVLAAGESVRVTIADGRSQCEYDMKFIYEDGTEQVQPGVNLCETGSYTLTE
ncbi:hypothetical protein [Chthonobacter albigriseus]|uniref:hypothetical protein n=1 Tax=Chthonobacter albigriseus TaxID=1683161 RepID=UPI0015EE9408|nr:hypothetical protein [Chthonobacter albigriseus]